MLGSRTAWQPRGNDLPTVEPRSSWGVRTSELELFPDDLDPRRRGDDPAESECPCGFSYPRRRTDPGPSALVLEPPTSTPGLLRRVLHARVLHRGSGATVSAAVPDSANVDLYTATRHYFGWYAWNVLDLDARDIALHFGHQDGG